MKLTPRVERGHCEFILENIDCDYNLNMSSMEHVIESALSTMSKMTHPDQYETYMITFCYFSSSIWGDSIKKIQIRDPDFLLLGWAFIMGAQKMIKETNKD